MRLMIGQGDGMRRYLIIGLILFAAPAVAKKKVVAPMVATFSVDDIAWAQKGGTATINGSALMRTVGGDVKTCAAQAVNLIPDSPYARERMTRMFGGPDGAGYMAARRVPPLPPADSAYASAVKQDVCDSQGNFTFDHLAAGKYYVTAQVTWGIPTRYFTMTEGGMLMMPVVVTEGATKKVVLTP